MHKYAQTLFYNLHADQMHVDPCLAGITNFEEVMESMYSISSGTRQMDWVFHPTTLYHHKAFIIGCTFAKLHDTII